MTSHWRLGSDGPKEARPASAGREAASSLGGTRALARGKRGAGEGVLGRRSRLPLEGGAYTVCAGSTLGDPAQAPACHCGARAPEAAATLAAS